MSSYGISSRFISQHNSGFLTGSPFHKSKRRSFGDAGEMQVAHYLETQGFTILEKNYQIREGEIDIIATKDDLLLFVEVKTRKNNYFSLSQVITYSKQKKMSITAQHYLSQHPTLHKACRFDVALVHSNGTPTLTYIPHAFTASTF